MLNGITSKLQPARFENSAIHATNQSGGETVVIVGDKKNKVDELDDRSLNLAKQLGNNRSKRVKKIILTTPNDDDLNSIYKTLDTAKKSKHLACEIESMKFLDFKENHLYDPNIVYISYPMGKSEEMDSSLIEISTHRAALLKYTAHVKGAAELQGNSTDQWKHATEKLDGYYISPEDIKETNKAEIERNKNIKKTGEIACENCAVSRVSYNKRPVSMFITKPRSEYVDVSGMKSSGRSRERFG